MAGGIGKKEAERIVADSPVEGGMHNDLEMVERLARLTAIDATDSRWDTQTKRTVLVILLVAAVFGVWLSRSVLGFLTMAGIVAYLLNPVVDLAQRLRIRRSVTTISLFVLVFVLIILLPVLLVPILIQQLTELSRFDVSGIAFSLFIWFSKLLGNLPDRVEMLGFAIPTNPIVQQIEEGFRQIRFIPTVTEILNYVQQVLGTATTVVSTTALFGINFVGGIFQVFFGLLVVFFLSLYLTKDLPDIRNYVESLLPPSYQSEFREVLRRMGMIWQAFFRGQIILCTAVGVSTWLALAAVGMPGALVLGMIAGVLEIIPSLGPTLSTVPAVLVALTQGSDTLAVYGINNVGFALITVGLYFVIQQVESSILVPRIIGNSVNLHPIIVICGVVIGLNVGGILGAFLAAPLIASLRVLGSYIHAKLLDYPPFIGQELPKGRKRRYRRTVSGEELSNIERPLESRTSPEELTGSDEHPLGVEQSPAVGRQ